MEERIKKAALVMQSERALQEIVLLRDVGQGEAWDRLEDAWKPVNTIRQELLATMRPEEKLALERYRRDVRRLLNRHQPQPISATDFIPPTYPYPKSPILTNTPSECPEFRP